MKLRDWLVRLYPPRWRERYGDEFEALLEECLHSPLDVVDIFLGALDARLYFSTELNWRLMNMVNKLRTTFLMVFTAYIGFIIGGLSFYGLVDDSPAAALMKTDSALSTAWMAVAVGSLVTLLAVMVGGVPLGLAVLRRALSSKRQDLRLLLVPVFSFLALVVYSLVFGWVLSSGLALPGVVRSVSPDNFPIGNRLLLGGWMLLFVLGAIASTAAVWELLSKPEVEASTLQLPGRSDPLKLYEFAYPPAVAATLGMTLMLAATLVFGWLANSALPGWFPSNQGLLLTNTALSFGVSTAIMALSTGAAYYGLARGFTSRKRSET